MSRKPDYSLATSCGDRPETRQKDRPGRDNSVSASRHNLLTDANWSWTGRSRESGFKDKLLRFNIYDASGDPHSRFGLLFALVGSVCRDLSAAKG
jgi:hypothetical protein